jgi:endonuclease YncB( thermonuclease family)
VLSIRPTLFLGFVFVTSAAHGGPLAGRVVGVSDGDTITVLDYNKQQHKIRLAGIDAPEAHQPFGQKAKASLSALVFDRQVSADCGKVDRYRREVCKVIVDGIDVNLEQVKAGMAWWYRKYAKEQSPDDRATYEQAEFWAKARRLGLWADKNPTPPWEWRHPRSGVRESGNIR